MPVINVITDTKETFLTASELDDDPSILKIEQTYGINANGLIKSSVFITKEEITKIYQIYGEK